MPTNPATVRVSLQLPPTQLNGVDVIRPWPVKSNVNPLITMMSGKGPTKNQSVMTALPSAPQDPTKLPEQLNPVPLPSCWISVRADTTLVDGGVGTPSTPSVTVTPPIMKAACAVPAASPNANTTAPIAALQVLNIFCAPQGPTPKWIGDAMLRAGSMPQMKTSLYTAC